MGVCRGVFIRSSFGRWEGRDRVDAGLFGLQAFFEAVKAAAGGSGEAVCIAAVQYVATGIGQQDVFSDHRHKEIAVHRI